MMLGARTAAWSGKKLPYLRRVAYLESHGMEWIDTGIIPKIGDSFYIDFAYMNESFNTKWQQLISAGNSNYQLAFPFGSDYVIGGNGLYVRVFGGGKGYRSDTIRVPELLRDVRLVLSIESNGGLYYNIRCGSGSITETPISEIDGTYKNLLLFRRANVGYGMFKCFGFYMIRDGVEVSNLIPVLDLSGRPCFYDEVSGQLFYNQGTGEFTWGEL